MRSEFQVENLFLNACTTCNMGCSRCFGHLDKFDEMWMSMETARIATRFYFDHLASDARNPYIMLFGGEPLLNRDLLVEYVPWVQETYGTDCFRLCLFSNGLALDRELLTLFYRADLLLFVSLDGPYSIHLRNRDISGDQFEYIVSMIRMAVADDPDSVVPYCVIQKQDISSIHNSLGYISSLGVSRLAVAKDIRENWSDENRNTLIKNLRQFKRDHEIQIYLYPEIVSDCDTCAPKSIMIYPGGEIYDLCYTYACGLPQTGSEARETAAISYLGNLNGKPDLRMDIARKKRLISGNLQCSVTQSHTRSEVISLAAESGHPLFR